jgi:hypothetical protein
LLLSSEKPVSRFAFQICNLYRYSQVGVELAEAIAIGTEHETVNEVN